jgi:hypothetical protein
MDPLINLSNIVVDDIRDITLESCVGPHTITNTSAPQVDPNPSSHKATRPEKSIKDDLDFDHTPISQYFWHPRPPILEIPMGSKLIVMVVSMNYFPPPIEDSSTRRVIQGRRLNVQITTTFVSEHNYERPHTNDGI